MNTLIRKLGVNDLPAIEAIVNMQTKFANTDVSELVRPEDGEGALRHISELVMAFIVECIDRATYGRRHWNTFGIFEKIIDTPEVKDEEGTVTTEEVAHEGRLLAFQMSCRFAISHCYQGYNADASNTIDLAFTGNNARPDVAIELSNYAVNFYAPEGRNNVAVLRQLDTQGQPILGRVYDCEGSIIKDWPQETIGHFPISTPLSLENVWLLDIWDDSSFFSQDVLQFTNPNPEYPTATLED